MPEPITIIGGGLAGLALGIALRRRDIPARIIEAGAYPRHRVCGEFISGIDEEELNALGITDLFANAKRHHTTAWFDGTREFIRKALPSPAYGLSRHTLDAALAARFESLGGELRCGERGVEEDTPGTVWASGRLRRSSPWIGVKAHYENLELTADLEIHLQNRGYVGLTSVEDGRVNVCGLFHRTTPLPGDDALPTAVAHAGLLGLARRLRKARQVPGSLKGVTQFALGWQRDEDPRARIGDSAAMIPPFTGNGMTMAFQSALAAVEPLARWSGKSEEWPDVVGNIRETQRVKFSRRLAWARILQRILLHPHGRTLARYLLSMRLVRFESLYHRLR